MGLEAMCTATWGGARGHGKALLETTEIVFRGDFRVRVPLRDITSVQASGERLLVRWSGQPVTLELGAALAARWVDKIRNPPSRLDKLGVKPTSRVAAVGRLDADFLSELKARAADVQRNATAGAAAELIFYAASGPADLARLPALVAALAPDGGLWIIRPKGAALALTESAVRAAGKQAGLVDVKVAAFSPTHTAEKFVIPVARRGAPR